MGHGRVDFQFDFGHSLLSTAESHFRRVREPHWQGHRRDHQERNFRRSGTRLFDHRLVFPLSPLK